MKRDPALDISREALAEFCRRHHIRKLCFFGSVVRGEARSDSDLDVLVAFDPDFRVGYLGMARAELELTELMGRQVDLRTAAELSPYFRDQVLATAEVGYAAG